MDLLINIVLILFGIATIVFIILGVKYIWLEEEEEEEENKRTVLFVDDDSERLEQLEDIWQSENCTVYKASTIEDARRIVDEKLVDIVTIDLQMPTKNNRFIEKNGTAWGGLELIHLLKNSKKDIYPIIVSGYELKDIQDPSLIDDAKPLPFVHKNGKWIEDLKKRINDFFNSKDAISVM
jgi:CheY-like chemotaxis protein